MRRYDLHPLMVEIELERVRRGLNRGEVAEMCNINMNTVSNYYRRTPKSIDILLRMAEALGLEIVVRKKETKT